MSCSQVIIKLRFFVHTNPLSTYGVDRYYTFQGDKFDRCQGVTVQVRPVVVVPFLARRNKVSVWKITAPFWASVAALKARVAADKVHTSLIFLYNSSNSSSPAGEGVPGLEAEGDDWSGR